MLDDATAAGIAETDQLDWKSRLPPEGTLAQSDLVKDIAAFANSGGGLVVFGITERDTKATGRVDVGDVTESYERTLRRVAVTGIQPPVFGLDIVRAGNEGKRALVVVVPPSVDAPHLIYRGNYFGAPVRNHADTEWMRERQLEALYRIRLDERRNADSALFDLYDELAAGRATSERAWLIIVAQPRLPVTTHHLDRAEMQQVVCDTEPRALGWARRSAGVHPLEAVDRLNPRRGLRRWVLVNEANGSRSWREAWMAVHDSGAVSLAQAIGGHRISGSEMATLPGNRVRSAHIECSVVDVMALLREATSAMGAMSEYAVVLGIEWAGDEPLVVETVDGSGFRFDGTSIPLARYTKVRSAIRLDVDEAAYLEQVCALALDAVNQGGVQNLQTMLQSAR
ncbi:UNVERIFIED_ORG: ATP-binding protein [Bacillus sp. AZ43]